MSSAAQFSESTFKKWYNVVNMDDGRHEQRVASRFSTIVAFAPTIASSDIEPLIQAALGSAKGGTSPTMSRLIEALQAADENFAANANDRERQVLAASTLAAAMDAASATAAQAALAATTTFLAGARQSDLPMDLAGLGEVALLQKSRSMRERPKPSQASKELSIAAVAAEVAKAKEAPTADTIMPAVLALQQTMEQLIGVQAKTMSSVERLLQIQDEELDMLWWLLGRQSYDLRCAFEEVPENQRPLIFAKEIADRSKFPSSPPALLAIYSRAGMPSESVTLTAQVNAMPSDWVENVIRGKRVSNIVTPLHFALQRRQETGPNTDWVAPFSSVTGIDQDFEHLQTKLATMFYRERALLSMMA